jgi:hypothetical protein
MDLAIAKTILTQLGGGRFLLISGAKNLVGGVNSLSMKIGRNSKKVTHVRIVLNHLDLYDVEFLSIRNLNVKTVDTASGIYADDLQRVFTGGTGLDTHL